MQPDTVTSSASVRFVMTGCHQGSILFSKNERSFCQTKNQNDRSVVTNNHGNYRKGLTGKVHLCIEQESVHNKTESVIAGSTQAI